MHGPDAEGLRDAFDAWRTADSRNAAEFAALEATWETAEGLGATELGRARSLRPAPRRLAWATPPRLAFAAAAMVLIVLAVVLRPTGAGPLPVIAEAHATSVGEIRTLKLPDGSSVTLDTDTRLEVRFDDKVRKVTLERGRARFDVRPDAKRTFVVEAGGKTISTQDSGFDVELAPLGLCLSSLRGALEVRPQAAGLSAAPEFRLDGGRALRFTPGGAPLAPVEPAGKGSDQWVAGMLVFNGAPLSGALAETNRYSRRRIVLGDPSLGALKVTGAFRPLPVDALAASLAAAFGLRVEQGPGGDLVLIRPPR